MQDYVLMHTISLNAPPDRFQCQHFRKAIRLPLLPPLGCEIVCGDEYTVDGVRVTDGGFEVIVRTCAENHDSLAAYVGSCEAIRSQGWMQCDVDGRQK